MVTTCTLICKMNLIYNTVVLCAMRSHLDIIQAYLFIKADKYWIYTSVVYYYTLKTHKIVSKDILRHDDYD